MVVPMPGEEPRIITSKLNKKTNNVPPPPMDVPPMENPFGIPIPDGPIPF
jgi:replicative DNA helicase